MVPSLGHLLACMIYLVLYVRPFLRYLGLRSLAQVDSMMATNMALFLCIKIVHGRGIKVIFRSLALQPPICQFQFAVTMPDMMPNLLAIKSSQFQNLQAEKADTYTIIVISYIRQCIMHRLTK